jgi:hypothetical protein
MGDEHAIDDAETSDAYEGAADDGEAYDSNGRRKSWVTMGMNMGGWMGMKKGKKDEDFGVPLKKTVSGSSLPM